MAGRNDVHRRTARARAVWLAALAASLTACSLLLDLKTTQCASDTDCVPFGAGWTCQNASCVARTDAGGSEADAAVAQCSSNAECTQRNQGEPSLCVRPEGRCASPTLLSVCPFVLPTPTNEVVQEDAVVFGVFFPVQGPAPLTDRKALAYNLALNELHLAGGLRIGGKRTPFAAVVCDSDPKVVEQGLKHLVDTLHVPALVSLFSQDDMTRFSDKLTSANVFTVNPFDATEALLGVDTKRLVWNLLGTPEDIALAYKPLMSRAEAYTSQLHGKPPSLRVAVVTSTAATEKAMSAIVRDRVKGIQVNGAPFLDNPPSNQLSYSVTSIDSNPAADYSADAAAIATFKPNIVVLLTGGEEGQLVPKVDQLMKASADPLPFYILGPRGNAEPALLEYLGNAVVQASDSKRRRVVGVTFASATDLTQRDAYVQRMRDAWKGIDAGAGVYESVDNSYDAIYWVALASAAAGPGRTTGLELASGARKLLFGPPVYPGTVSALSKSALDIGNSPNGVQFVGALGPPDIDITTGTWRRNGSVYCPVQLSPGVIDMRYDVLRYDRADGQLKGYFDCYIGF
jgi:ABC-type branched-subunit amino acid transport system substrate-binding protein